MKFYDLHVHLEDLNRFEDVVKIAETLEFSGLGLVEYYNNLDNFRELKKKIKALNTNLDLITCIEIEAEGVKQLRRIVSKVRKLAEVVIVSGGEYKINRAAVEDSRVDILSHPGYKRNDSGVDHVIAKAAAQNNVAIEINFHEILETYRKVRSHVLSHMKLNIKLAKGYNTPIIITSGSKNKWEMRDPRELAAIGQILGMNLEDSMKSVSDVPRLIVETNRKKISGGDN